MVFTKFREHWVKYVEQGVKCMSSKTFKLPEKFYGKWAWLLTKNILQYLIANFSLLVSAIDTTSEYVKH